MVRAAIGLRRGKGSVMRHGGARHSARDRQHRDRQRYKSNKYGSGEVHSIPTTGLSTYADHGQVTGS
jgi:hypothetical protein